MAHVVKVRICQRKNIRQECGERAMLRLSMQQSRAQAAAISGAGGYATSCMRCWTKRLYQQ